MKKYLKLTCLVLALLALVGCGGKEDKKADTKVITCDLVSTDTANGYQLTSSYEIHAKDDVVEKVVTIETVTSEDQDILDMLEETLKSTYDAVAESYGGYTIDITNEDGKVISEVTVDYNELDLEAYIADNTAMEQYVNDDNKLLVSGIQELYESYGAVCEEK